MPSNCAVFGCFSYRGKSNDVTFHKFPKDTNTRKTWIHLCKRADPINVKNAQICSKHFEAEAFERNLMYELLNQPVPRSYIRIKEGSVPTLHLPSTGNSHASQDAVNVATGKKSRKCHVSQSAQTVSKEGTKKPKAARKKQGNATKKADEWGINNFIEWLEANKLPKQFESLPKEELDQLLARLYGETQNKKGKKFTKTAHIHIRDAIQKHLESSPWNIDYVIKTDLVFSKSNKILDELECQDCPLKPCDVEHLVKTGTLGMHDPTALQNLVWISLALHLGDLNIMQWTEMTKRSFVRSTDESGMDYIGWSGCSTKSKVDDPLACLSTSRYIKIYALPQDPLCPVKAFDMYMSLLHPATNDLWQKPSTAYKKTNKWYQKVSVGKRTFEDMMKNMCVQAKLSKLHSNKCIHITSSTVLMEANIQESDVQVSGPRRSIRPRRRKIPREKEGLNWQEENQTHSCEGIIPREKEGLNWQEENQTHSFEGAGPVNNVSSSDTMIKVEDIKIEEEDPLAFAATEDIPGDDNELEDIPNNYIEIEDTPGDYSEILPRKRRRLRSDRSADNKLNEEQIDPFADDVADAPSMQHTTVNACEDREEEEESSLSLVDEEESLKMHEIENSTASQYSQPCLEIQKKDVYDDFGSQIAKTLRDLNDQATFRRVKIDINKILLDALSGNYKNHEISDSQLYRLLTKKSTDSNRITHINKSTQTDISPVNDVNSNPVLCIINPKNVIQNQMTSECLLSNSVNTVQTVQSTLNKGHIFCNNLPPRPVILTPQSLNSGSAIPVNSAPILQTPNPVTSGLTIQNSNPDTSGLTIQNSNPDTSGLTIQNSNPVTSGLTIQNSNPVSFEPANQDSITEMSVNQNLDPAMSEYVSQDSNPVSSELIIQNQNLDHLESFIQTLDQATSESAAQNPNQGTLSSVGQNPNPIIVNPDPDTSESMVQNSNPTTSGPVIENPNTVTSGSILQNLNLATFGPIIQNKKSIVHKPFNLGQLVNNPMNLWQMIKNPQMPEQVMLRPINLRQMSQIVGNMKQTVPQPAPSVATGSAQNQVTSTFTRTPVSRNGSDP